MSKAATGALNLLHGMVAETFLDALKQAKEERLPVDAATMSAMIRFLKDNDVTADPAATDDLKEMRNNLQDQVQAQRELRRQRREAALKLADSDLKALGG